MSSRGSNASLQALDGRLPVLAHERIYGSYGSMLWTTAVLSAASWAYLIGSTFPSFGNTRLVILGYLIGLLIGEVLAVFAVGIPSFRYGVDTVDAAKASLGSRGAVVLLVMVLATSLGWAYVLMAMTARGVGRLVSAAASRDAPVDEHLVIASALGLLLLVWCLARRGPAAMERLSKICAAGQILIALIILGCVVSLQRMSPPLAHGGYPAHPITTDPLTQIAYGVEFGFDNALTMLPFLGGLTRLVRHRRHIVGPTLIGSAILGAWLVAAVAALAAGVVTGSDPTIWIVELMGPAVGSVVVGFLLVANLGTLVVLVYVASVAVQQARPVAALRWDWIIGLTLLPGAIFAFRTEWLLARVMTWLAYNGVMFVGLSAVLMTDFFFLKSQRIRVSHLFASPGKGIYWYAGGVNWIAMGAIVVCAGIYLALFDPISLHVHPLFRYVGAGIPAVLLGSMTYYLAMRLLPAGPREPDPGHSKREAIQVGL
ncbi:MAG TPA: cytosine permease [Steroidobacteraceae bacterium]|jgi:NCS1 family nucleobase:cation symporter-1|nr:cytosine permease [Steroidobacteraceae bacterium]